MGVVLTAEDVSLIQAAFNAAPGPQQQAAQQANQETLTQQMEQLNVRTSERPERSVLRFSLSSDGTIVSAKEDDSEHEVLAELNKKWQTFLSTQVELRIIEVTPSPSPDAVVVEVPFRITDGGIHLPDGNRLGTGDSPKAIGIVAAGKYKVTNPAEKSIGLTVREATAGYGQSRKLWSKFLRTELGVRSLRRGTNEIPLSKARALTIEPRNLGI